MNAETKNYDLHPAEQFQSYIKLKFRQANPQTSEEAFNKIVKTNQKVNIRHIKKWI